MDSRELPRHQGSKDQEPERQMCTGAQAPPKHNKEVMSRLLRLAPELRNCIYRHALLEPDIIEINASQHLEPGLLRTCQQIRNEAGSIFFGENRFMLRVTGFQMDMPNGHWANNKIGRLLQLGLDGANQWSNLRQWLKAYHGVTYTPGLVSDDSVAKRVRVAAHAFRIVAVMKVFEWEVVEKVLEEYEKGTELLDGTWSWT
ncbi:hypothetical protein LTR85_008924 [Meristemomyces frigidus]|nr:hypothetical protein LTR85_008924 [Meristemomyces frigidus]